MELKDGNVEFALDGACERIQGSRAAVLNYSVLTCGHCSGESIPIGKDSFYVFYRCRQCGKESLEFLKDVIR